MKEYFIREKKKEKKSITLQGVLQVIDIRGISISGGKDWAQRREK
jgi:hypothetical protein